MLIFGKQIKIIQKVKIKSHKERKNIFKRIQKALQSGKVGKLKINEKNTLVAVSIFKKNTHY